MAKRVDAHGKPLPFVEIHIGLLAHQIGVSTSDPFDFRQGVHDFLLSLDVGIQETQDELEVRLFTGDQR